MTDKRRLELARRRRDTLVDLRDAIADTVYHSDRAECPECELCFDLPPDRQALTKVEALNHAIRLVDDDIAMLREAMAHEDEPGVLLPSETTAVSA